MQKRKLIVQRGSTSDRQEGKSLLGSPRTDNYNHNVFYFYCTLKGVCFGVQQTGGEEAFGVFSAAVGQADQAGKSFPGLNGWLFYTASLRFEDFQ